MSVDTSKVATSNRTEAATASKPGPDGSLASWADDRLGLATAMKKNLRKVFPDHWSFMLGEIALWSFVVLLLTGVFLTLWFNPSMGGMLCTTCRVPGSAGPAAETITLLGALLAGDWPTIDAADPRHLREASGLVAAFLAWHLERGLRSLAYVER